MDPVKFKKILIRLLQLLVIIELVGALSVGASQGQWERFGADLIIAGILYIMWERIRTRLKGYRLEYKRKVEETRGKVRLWDAMMFSLLWSDEIYREIPDDRRRFIIISYTLIALGLVAAFVNIGSGLMPLVVSGALVLAAVNLVVWVVGKERIEKEDLQTELRLARDVQLSLMPKEQPHVPGCDIAGLSLPAKEVGGDLYDYVCLGNKQDCLGVSVVDVSGKGMKAAMSAVFTSGAFATEAQKSSSPAEILTRLNKAVCTHAQRGHFVAFLLASIEHHTRMLTFSNAGQTRPVLRSNGTIQSLEAVGVHFPLGMREESTYQERNIQLAAGDVVVFLTDGFTDAMNKEQEVYGLERFERLLARLDVASMSAQTILEAVAEDVRLHVGVAPQHDDMTMVVLKVA